MAKKWYKNKGSNCMTANLQNIFQEDLENLFKKDLKLKKLALNKKPKCFGFENYLLFKLNKNICSETIIQNTFDGVSSYVLKTIWNEVNSIAKKLEVNQYLVMFLQVKNNKDSKDGHRISVIFRKDYISLIDSNFEKRIDINFSFIYKTYHKLLEISLLFDFINNELKVLEDE